MTTTRLPSVLTCFALVACGAATAIVPDDGSGGGSGTGGATASGGVTGAGSKVTGGVTGAGGKVIGGVTGAGGKAKGGVTGAGGTITGGVTSAGGTVTGGQGGNTSTRWAKEYDQLCKFDEDCVAVTEGPACTCNFCFNASINRNALERWETAAGPCVRLPCDSIGCVDVVPACRGGRCDLRKVDDIQPGQFDRTCSQQSDCYLVPIGDLCAGCNCEFDAVSVQGLEQYKTRVSNGSSSCGSPNNGVCDCALPKPVCRLDGSRTQCAALY